MQLGVLIRNMGPASTRDLVVAAARAADACPAVSDVWVVDHVAIPPDDAEGSGGRYLDPLATLAVLAGVTADLHRRSAAARVPPRARAPRGLAADGRRSRRAPRADRGPARTGRGGRPATARRHRADVAPARRPDPRARRVRRAPRRRC